MKLYQDLLYYVLKAGNPKPSGRDISDTRSIFNWNGELDMADGFPLLTTKKVNFDAVARELQWFLSGDPSIKGYDLKFWEPWAGKNGEVPSPYGYYWREWPNPEHDYDDPNSENFIDQLGEVVRMLKENPFTRRAVVLAWEPSNALSSKLPPCHYTFVFNYDGERLNLHLTQRSGDIPIGIPFNWASYSLLLHIVAKQLEMTPGKFGHTIVDAHIYESQVELVEEQLARVPYKLPTIELDDDVTIDNFTPEKVRLIGYEHHPFIKYPVEV